MRASIHVMRNHSAGRIAVKMLDRFGLNAPIYCGSRAVRLKRHRAQIRQSLNDYIGKNFEYFRGASPPERFSTSKEFKEALIQLLLPAFGGATFRLELIGQPGES